MIREFDKYIRKVFKIEELLEQLKDTRVAPTIDIQNIVFALLYGSSFHIRGIQEVERECKEGVLKKRIGPISDDTFGYGLNHLELESLQKVWEDLVRRMKRNGMIRQGKYGSSIVGILDGIEIVSSYSRCCTRCLVREIETKEGTEIQYYHRMVVLCLTGYDFSIPIGLEFMKPGEGEVECAVRLLKRLAKSLGRGFIDAVIADALYCTPYFFEECSKLRLKVGVVLKANQEELLAEAERLKKESEPALVTDREKKKLKIWDSKEVYWDTARKTVRVIWGEREEWKVEEKGKKREGHWEKKRNVFVFSEDFEQFNCVQLYDMGRHRWDIDASLFEDLTQNWFLKHATLHFCTAYENLQIIRVIAFFLFMFFLHRHINSRRKNKIKKFIVLATLLYQAAVIILKPP